MKEIEKKIKELEEFYQDQITLENFYPNKYPYIKDSLLKEIQDLSGERRILIIESIISEVL